MATKPFVYQDPYPLGEDKTKYRKRGGSEKYVSIASFEGKEILKVDPEALTILANEAMRDISFLLRREHNESVGRILRDPEASQNDKGVAVAFLRNAEISAQFELPVCQDTGTATIIAKKGQQVWTGGKDEEALSKGVYKTYTEENLRYSQTVALDMYREVNSGTNLPAQIDIQAVDGESYKFLFMAKGGGSANKTSLFQETKALLAPESLLQFLVGKMKHLGTAACPPYHIAVVVGGTSADACLKAVKLASAKYYDELPTHGNEYGQAFRDLELEQKLLDEAYKLGIGAQFGGKYFAHDVRVVRLPRHGASCPLGMAVSCSADRNVKAKITRDGIFVEELDRNPGRLIPGRIPRQAGARCQHRPESADEGYFGRALQAPGFDSASAQRHHHCRTRHCPREIQGAHRRRQAGTGVSAQASNLLRRSGQDPEREGVRLLRSDDRRPDGFLCGSAAEQGRQHDHDRQGQPFAAGDQCLQEVRRVLPRLHRRPGRGAGRRKHQEGRMHRLPGTGDEAVWKIEVENFPAFILVDDKERLFQAIGAVMRLVGFDDLVADVTGSNSRVSQSA